MGQLGLAHAGQFPRPGQPVAALSEADLPRLEQEAIDAMADRGLALHTVDEATIAEWEQRAVTGREAIIGSTISQELFDEILRLVEEFRSNSASE